MALHLLVSNVVCGQMRHSQCCNCDPNFRTDNTLFLDGGQYYTSNFSGDASTIKTLEEQDWSQSTRNYNPTHLTVSTSEILTKNL